jgi:hypothetical protein
MNIFFRRGGIRFPGHVEVTPRSVMTMGMLADWGGKMALN